MAKKRAPAREGRAGKAREKLADLPDLIPHHFVAEKLGITTTTLRDWVYNGMFPRPHAAIEHTWLYRVDWVREFLETGRWPKEATFNRATRPQDGES
jgi:hypothetical protein